MCRALDYSVPMLILLAIIASQSNVSMQENAGAQAAAELACPSDLASQAVAALHMGDRQENVKRLAIIDREISDEIKRLQIQFN
jgi:hypothetical protein